MVDVFHRDFVEFDYNFIYSSKPQINIQICAQPHLKFLKIHAIKSIDHDITME